MKIFEKQISLQNLIQQEQGDKNVPPCAKWGACIRVRLSAALLHDIQHVLLLPPFREGGAVLGTDEFLVMLEGKIREAPFFKVQSGKITV